MAGWTAGSVETVPFQDSERIRGVAPGLTEERLRASFHIVAPGGAVTSGPEAIPELAALVLPGGRAAAWLLRRAPGSRRLMEWTYRWISERRW